jgi:XTP/dITP diphosphohydrolase
MKTDKIVIATRNENKAKEIAQILNTAEFDLVSLNHCGEIADVDENGLSFYENALIKANHYHRKTGCPVIADDSGLVVPALSGEPGIYSARYAGPGAGYHENNVKLLKMMEHLKDEERQAHFVCVAIYLDPDRTISAEGYAYGKIIDEPRGQNGFGYDPIFFHPPSQKTFAELDNRTKNGLSHRYMALSYLKGKLLVEGIK